MKAKLVHIIIILLFLATSIIPIINAVSEINTKSDDNWHYLPSYRNYAPNGLPDFCQRQHGWRYIIDGGNGIAESLAEGDDNQITPYHDSIILGRPVITMGKNCYLESTTGGDDLEFWNFCLLASLADCFWWLDSKYETPNGTAGDGIDSIPIVTDYGVGDDHSPENAPLLICDLAHMQGIPCYNKSFLNMNFLEEWIQNKGLGEMFELSIYNYPTFDLIAEEVLQNKPVVLRIYFYKKNGDYFEFAGNHYVSCAGVNKEEMKIAFSDPFLDIQNPIENEDWEESITHNNPSNVSHDIYQIAFGSPFINDYETKCWLPDYWPYYDICQINWAMTIDELNTTHDRPIIDGPKIGRPGKNYTFIFTNTEPDVDEVSYYIDWGDNSSSGWTRFRASDDPLMTSHTWSEKCEHTIRVKIKDMNGKQSRWGEHNVDLTKEKSLFRFSLSKFFNSHPLLSMIFQRLGLYNQIEMNENHFYMSSMNYQIQHFGIFSPYDSPNYYP